MLQVPPLTRYCKAVPTGQGVPAGAEMLPPAGVQFVEQVLFTIETLAGATVNVGQVGQTTGAVVADAVVLTQPVVVFLQRANTAKAAFV